MADERDRRRNAHRDHAGWGRAPVAQVAAGEHDSDDNGWRDAPTPPARPIASVVVDPAAMRSEVERDYPAAFAELLARVTAAEDDAAEARRLSAKCAAAEARRDKRRAWMFGGGGISGATVVGFLIWAVTKLDARADAAAEDRLRIRMLNRHEAVIETLQLQSAAHAALLGLRAMTAPNP